MKKWLSFILFLLLSSSEISQLSVQDSLFQVSQNADTLSRLEAYKNLIIRHYIYQDSDSAFEIAGDALILSRKAGIESYEALFLNIQGVSLDLRGLKR